MVTALLTWLVAINPVVRFTGDVGCPSAAEVDARLRTLLPTAPGTDERDLATLETSGARLRVTVRRPDGTTLGARELGRDHSCPELAAAVALVIATWESDVHPEFALALPAAAEPARPQAVSAVRQASSPPEPPRAAEPPGLTVAPGRARPLERVATTRRPRPSAFDLGAALVAAAAPHTLDGTFESDLVAAASVVAGWVHHGSGPGARVAFGLATERLIPLGPGEVHWRRATAALGPQLRVSTLGPTTILDLHGELIAAALNIRGERFSSNGNDWSFDVGVGAGARWWMGTTGTWRPWVDLSVAVWPTEHVVYTAPSEEAVSLPRVETLLALGVAFWRS